MQENHVVIKWAPSVSDCEVTYKISVKLPSDNEPTQYQTTNCFLTISDEWGYCSIMEISIKATVNEIESDPNFILYKVLPPPEKVAKAEIKNSNYNEATRTITWDAMHDFPGCDIKYQITMNGQTIAMADSTIHEIPANHLPLDGNDVTITPVVEKMIGKVANVYADRNEFEVCIINDIDKAEIKNPNYNAITRTLTWDEITDFPGCDVKYQIMVNDQTPVMTDIAIYQILEEHLLLCSNDVTITPIIDTLLGKGVDVDVVKVPPLQEELDKIEIKNPDYYEATRMLTWVPVTDFIGCDIKYQIMVNGQTSVVTDIAIYQIPEEHLILCSNDVMITPMIETLLGKGTDVDTVKVTPDKEDIYKAEIKNPKYNEATRILTWDPITNFPSCDIEYQITVNNKTPVLTDIAIYQIPEGHLSLCSNDVIITPMIYTLSGKDVDVDVVKVTPGQEDLDKAEIQNPNYNEVTRVLTWNAITDFLSCDIKYQIMVNDQPPVLIDTVIYQIPEAHLLLCSNDVTITPVIATLLGKGADVGVVKVPPVQEDIDKVEINNPNYNETTRMLTWDAITDFIGCDVKYQVVVNKQTPVLTHIAIYQIPEEHLFSCNNDVTIRPVINTMTGRAVYTDVVKIPLLQDDVDKIEIKNPIYDEITRTLTWDAITDFDRCDIKYQVSVNQNSAEAVTATYEIPLDLLLVCSNEVTITPMIDTLVGAPTTINVVKEPPAQENVNNAEITNAEYNQETRTLTWDKIAGFDGCTITYQVVVNGEAPVAAESATYQIPADQLLLCSNEVTITPVVETVSGITADIDIVKVQLTQDDVNKAQINNPSYDELTRTVTWDAITDFDACDIKYLVTVNDQTPAEVQTETYVMPGEHLTVCSNVVTITPVIDTLTGVPTAIEVVIDVEDVTNVGVGDLSYKGNDDGWTITWNIPTNYEKCNVIYKVYLNDISSIIIDNDNKIEYLNGDTNPCVENTVMVIPFIESKEGAPTAITIMRNPASVANVENGKMKMITGNELKVSWSKPAGLEACDFTYKLELSKDGSVIDQNDSIAENEWQKLIEGIDTCDTFTASVMVLYKLREGDPTQIECA